MDVEPDPYFRTYNPQMYRGLTITDEGDGYFRIYSGKEQLGWASSLAGARALSDRRLSETVRTL